jgi:hypothetical protein
MKAMVLVPFSGTQLAIYKYFPAVIGAYVNLDIC